MSDMHSKLLDTIKEGLVQLEADDLPDDVNRCSWCFTTDEDDSDVCPVCGHSMDDAGPGQPLVLMEQVAAAAMSWIPDAYRRQFFGTIFGTKVVPIAATAGDMIVALDILPEHERREFLSRLKETLKQDAS